MSAVAIRKCAGIATDALTIVFGFLDPAERAVSKAVCRRWHPLNPPVAADGKPLVLCFQQFATSIPLLEWAQTQGCRPTPTAYARACLSAIETGHMDVVRYTYPRARGYDQRCILPHMFTIAAARCDRLEALQWLASMDALAPWWAFSGARTVRVLDWVKNNASCEMLKGYDMRDKIGSSTLDVLKWYTANGYLNLQLWDIVQRIARTRSAEKLAWLLSTVDPSTPTFMTRADNLYLAVVSGLGSNVIGCMELLYANGLKPAMHVRKVCLHAAKSCTLPVLQWLVAHKAGWDKVDCLRVAENRHMEYSSQYAAAERHLSDRMLPRANALWRANCDKSLKEMAAVVAWIRAQISS
jgi:hypothetical protein